MSNNILSLAKELGVQPRRVSSAKGGEYHSPCPGCGGKDRFHIWPEQNNGEGSFWCRGCGKGGDAIQFLRDFSGLSFREAAQKVGRELAPVNSYISREIPTPKKKAPWVPDIKERPTNVDNPETWEEHAAKFVEHCHKALLQSANNMEWLGCRGINKESVIKWKLGLHETKGMRPAFRPRTSWGMKGGNNPKTGRPFMFVLPAGIVIPWMDDQGRIQRLRIRLGKVDPQDPRKKYHAVCGSIMNSFITHRNTSIYVVVETELDAVMLDELGGDLVGVVAVGSSHAKPAGLAGEAVLKAKQVINALDYDQAGANAGRWWSVNIPHTIRRPVPFGKDPGDFYQESGRQMVRRWIMNGLPAEYQQAIQHKKNDQLAVTLGDRHRRCQEVHHNPPCAYHPKVLRLLELLKICPVIIQITDSEYGIVKLSGYCPGRHWELYREVSKIVFDEPGMSYLHGLNKEIITVHNLIPEKEVG